MTSAFAVQAEHQRLVFEPSPRGGYGFAVEFLRADGWRRVSADNPLVRGRSFDLRPTVVKCTGASALEFSGEAAALAESGAALRLPFRGSVRLNEAADWFDVEVLVDVAEPLRLQMLEGFEPEITVDLGPLPPYDRGDHVWFKTNIDNPTVWNGEARGNDFPALYYFDSYLRYDAMMFFDMTAMEWMGRGNIARFLNYRCGFRRSYRPSPRHEIGLYADGCSGTTFPAGERRFAYSLKLRPRPEAPTEATALTELVSECLKLAPDSPSFSPFPPGATTWKDFAAHCADELMDPQCWGNNERFGDYILNYVNGYSPAWAEAFAGKNLTIDFRSSPCIDSAAFIGFPLAVLGTLRPESRYAALLERIRAFVADFLASPANPYRGGDGVAGTWQHVYILEQLWSSATLHDDRNVLDMAMAELHGRVIPLARGAAYLFPLSFDRETLRKSGNGDAYAVAGLYAYFMFNIYRTGGDAGYLEEAKRALRALLHLPVDSLSQEVFLLGLGVQAADLVHRETGEAVFKEVYDYLLAQNLRMMYWYTDRTLPEYREYNIYGMFQACTPIIYPAFFENIECLARIASTLETNPPSPGLLRVFDHARRNNFYMFPACLPPNRHTSSLKHIPFENLGVLEDEKTGWIGQEIYGCGQVFQAYLMWEALASADDRAVMVLNLSNYRAFSPAGVAQEEWTFAIFNPEAEARAVRIDFPATGAQQAFVGPSLDRLEPVAFAQHSLPLSLEPNQVLYLKTRR